jgi:hypothetical protein
MEPTLLKEACLISNDNSPTGSPPATAQPFFQRHSPSTMSDVWDEGSRCPASFFC